MGRMQEVKERGCERIECTDIDIGKVKDFRLSRK